MKNRLLSYGIIFLVLGLTSCHTNDSVKFQFDSKKIVSGKKIAIKDIAPQLPTDWDEYDYVTIEFRSTTPQRFQLGFTTDSGYNELRLISYVPNAWNKLTIPLRFFLHSRPSSIDRTCRKRAYSLSTCRRDRLLTKRSIAVRS